jgi:hypothetical protein
MGVARSHPVILWINLPRWTGICPCMRSMSGSSSMPGRIRISPLKRGKTGPTSYTTATEGADVCFLTSAPLSFADVCYERRVDLIPH